MPTKGMALAIDLSLAVGVASLLLCLISTQIPLDTPAARTPIGLCVAAALIYLGVGRDHLFSPGRRILRLRLVRLPGNVPGLLGRSTSVHLDPVPDKGIDPLARAAALIALGTGVSIVSLAGVMSTTRIFATVHDYAASRPLVAGEMVELSRWPRALLVGQRRGYVQVDARGPSATTTLEFFLQRDGEGWRVTSVRKIAPGAPASFSLGVSDAEVPTPPTD